MHATAEAVELRRACASAPFERRALGGGVGDSCRSAIRAEQHGTRRAARLGSHHEGLPSSLGDRVTRGQLLGIVASSDVSTARARLEQARARLSAAEATLRRQQQLSTEGIGAQRALIEAEAQVGELRAEVEGLRSASSSVFGSGSGGELA